MNTAARIFRPLWPARRGGPRFPLLALLNPGRLAWPSAVALVWGLALGLGLYRFAGWPAWSITLVVIAVLLPVGVVKWREDLRLYGAGVMLLSILLITQGLHTVEHFVQWGEYYMLLWPARQSTGLISAANSEWVHFIWNWSVLLVLFALLWKGMRSWLAVLLLLVAGAHAVEHTYLFLRYQEVLGTLHDRGVFTVTAQGLPGIVGRDGWLARSVLTRNSFICVLPGLTTAMRLDVHFWWNAIEMTLLLGAGSLFMRGRVADRP